MHDAMCYRINASQVNAGLYTDYETGFLGRRPAHDQQLETVASGRLDQFHLCPRQPSSHCRQRRRSVLGNISQFIRGVGLRTGEPGNMRRGEQCDMNQHTPQRRMPADSKTHQDQDMQEHTPHQQTKPARFRRGNKTITACPEATRSPAPRQSAYRGVGTKAELLQDADTLHMSRAGLKQGSLDREVS